MTVRTLLYGNPVPGYPSLLVIVLFLGGIQLLSIGVIGEYLGRMFDKAKKRPLYFLKAYRRSLISTAVASKPAVFQTENEIPP